MAIHFQIWDEVLILTLANIKLIQEDDFLDLRIFLVSFLELKDRVDEVVLSLILVIYYLVWDEEGRMNHRMKTNRLEKRKLDMKQLSLILLKL